MNILWLKTELLHPIDKGGKIRTYHMLRELKRDHHVTYLTLDDGAADETARKAALEYCHELISVPHSAADKFSFRFYIDLFVNQFSTLPYALSKYKNDAMRDRINKLIKESAIDLVICDFLTPAVNLPHGLDCPTVLFQHNVEAMIWKRHYEVQSNPLKKLVLFEQYRKTRTFEREACRRFDVVVAVSVADAETMRREYGVENVDDVPTGVDTEFFTPSGTVDPIRNNLVFTGSMDWLPNEDAIRWFTESIMPRIAAQIPDVSLTVVGRSPRPELIALGRTNPSIEVTGRVPDVRPYIERASAYVVPIRIGGGTRLKIYEAMAMECATVSTTIGAEGLPVVENQHLLIADSDQEFANSVIRVLTDETLSRELGTQAAELVRAEFGWRGVTDRFWEICQRALVRSHNSESETAIPHKPREAEGTTY